MGPLVLAASVVGLLAPPRLGSFRLASSRLASSGLVSSLARGPAWPLPVLVASLLAVRRRPFARRPVARRRFAPPLPRLCACSLLSAACLVRCSPFVACRPPCRSRGLAGWGVWLLAARRLLCRSCRWARRRRSPRGGAWGCGRDGVRAHGRGVLAAIPRAAFRSECLRHSTAPI